MWGHFWLVEWRVPAGCPLQTITRPVLQRQTGQHHDWATCNLCCWESIYPTTQSAGPAMPPGHTQCHQLTTWNSYFCLYKTVTTHIGSCTCQTEGKGVTTVTMQYTPSSRAEDHEAGPVGAPGACPVWPVANVAPGKQNCTSHCRSWYCMWHCTVSAYVLVYIDVQYRIIQCKYSIYILYTISAKILI